MKRPAAGMVNARGESALPGGIFDMAGDKIEELGEQAEAELKKIYKDLDPNAPVVAKYKVEVMFTDNRSLHRPFDGVISVWTNGGAYHGGGDQAVYLCPQPHRDDTRRYCGSPIDLAFVADGFALCPVCHQKTPPDELCNAVGYKLTFQNWMRVMVRAFRRLECNADVRIKYFIGDLRTATEIEQNGKFGGEVMRKFGRTRRDVATYPLERIIADTTAGASLESRFRAFLLS